MQKATSVSSEVEFNEVPELQNDLHISVTMRRVCQITGALHEIATHAGFKLNTSLEQEANRLLEEVRNVIKNPIHELVKRDRNDEFTSIKISIILLRASERLIEKNSSKPCVRIKKRKPSKVINIRR